MSNEKDFVVEVSFEFQFLIGKVQQNIMEKKKATRIIKFQFLIGKVQRYFYMTFQDEAKDLFQFLIGKVQRNST